MRPATINVRVDNPVSFGKYDIITGPIEWRKDYREGFFFIKAEFWPESEQNPVPCLIFFAESSPHFQSPFNTLEIITRELDLKGMIRCAVLINDDSMVAQ